MRFFIVSILLLGTASLSHADVLLRASLMYESTNDGADGATVAGSQQLLDLGVGYLDKSWFYGLLQSTDSYSPTSTANRTSMGPTIGWVSRKDSGGFFSFFTYFLSSSRQDKMSGGGYQLDLGMTFPTKHVIFAPQLTYRHLEYDKMDGNTMTPKYVQTHIQPYFTFLFVF